MAKAPLSPWPEPLPIDPARPARIQKLADSLPATSSLFTKEQRAQHIFAMVEAAGLAIVEATDG